MFDESIPTTSESFEEWGMHGSGADDYEYMAKSYSPYDNVTAQAAIRIYW